MSPTMSNSAFSCLGFHSFVLQILVPFPSCPQSLTGTPWFLEALWTASLTGTQSWMLLNAILPSFSPSWNSHWGHLHTETFISTPGSMSENPNSSISKIWTQQSDASTLLCLSHPPLSWSANQTQPPLFFVCAFILFPWLEHCEVSFCFFLTFKCLSHPSRSISIITSFEKPFFYFFGKVLW